MTNEYQRDEFDDIAERGGPVGVHRAPRPWWTLVLWPVLIFMVAGLAAFLIANVLWDGGGSDADPSPSATVSATASPTATPSASATAEPSATSSPEPTEPEPAAPVIEFDTPIAVLNGTGISGLAGGQADLLTDAGFTDVTATNLSGSAPSANRVVYGDDALADTAREVAAQLGIEAVESGAPQSDADIEVQLVTDPR